MWYIHANVSHTYTRMLLPLSGLSQLLLSYWMPHSETMHADLSSSCASRLFFLPTSSPLIFHKIGLRLTSGVERVSLTVTGAQFWLYFKSASLINKDVDTQKFPRGWHQNFHEGDTVTDTIHQDLIIVVLTYGWEDKTNNKTVQLYIHVLNSEVRLTA